MRGGYYLGALTLFCFTPAPVLSKEVNCSEVAEKHCERKSEFFNFKNDNGSQCGNLDYCEPQAEHCFIKNHEEWNCLRRKAQMMDDMSRACWSPDGSANGIMAYIEVCVFADDNYVCNPNCTETEAHQMECRNKSVEYRETCIPSLVYCSPHEHGKTGCSLSERINNVQKAFFENCFEPYEHKYGKHEIWYYVDRAHFDNTSLDYSVVMPVNPLRIGDFEYLHKRLCPQKLPLYAIALITIAMLLVISTAAYGAWKFRKYEKQQEKRWNFREGMEATLDTDIPMMPQEEDQQPEDFEEFVPGVNWYHKSDRNGSNLTHENGNRSYTTGESTNGSLMNHEDAKRTLLANHSYTGVLSEMLESNNNTPCIIVEDPCVSVPLDDGGSLHDECKPLENQGAGPEIGSYIKHTALQ